MNLNLKLKFLLLVLVAVLVVPVSTAGQSFDRSLDEVARLNSAGKHAELLDRLAGLKPSPELADLHMFLEAEALKNLGRKAEAFKVYDRIVRQFPGTESAFQSQMPHFMLQLDAAGPLALAALEAEAAALSTQWQRGTAFQKLYDLPFLDRAQKSRMALNSVRQFRSDRPFYKTAPACADMLKKMLGNPAEFSFTDDEWLEILLAGSQESLIGEFFKKTGSQAAMLGRYGQPAIDLFRAENLRLQKKLPQAMEIYNTLISSRRIAGPLLALAYQLRGDANHFAENHAAAAGDYREALKWRKFPVDVQAAEYRLMRSAFRIGRDAECLEILGRLVKNMNSATLLPVHVYEMGLECFDAGQATRAVPYFMLLSRSFPGHHRADDGLGYAALAVGPQSAEGQSIIKLLKKKYPNSFYISWVAPTARNEKLIVANGQVPKLEARLQSRVAALKRLWNSQFAGQARAEAIRLTDANPGSLGLYHAIIEIARANKDYSQIVAYGERLARQTLEADKSLAEMPEWGWRALYPLVFEAQVGMNAKKFGIDPFWILSIMREESHFKVDTLSRSNAMSLMQILPSTGKWIAGKLGEKGFKKDLLWNVDLNIRYGAWYLRYLADLFNGDLYLASASYNGGQGNIQRKVEAGPHAGLPVLDRLDRVPLPETRDYYKKVMSSHWNYTRLYKAF